MTACRNFQMSLAFRKEPCLAGHDNAGKLDYWPCCIYGQGFCNDHATGEPKVDANKMPNFTPAFEAFGDNPKE